MISLIFLILVAACASLVVVSILFQKINSGFWSGIILIVIACLLQLSSMPPDYETNWKPNPSLEYWGWGAFAFAAVSLCHGLIRRVRVKYPRHHQPSWKDYWTARL